VEKAAGGRSRALELVLKILSDVLGQHEHSSKVGVQSMVCLEIGWTTIFILRDGMVRPKILLVFINPNSFDTKHDRLDPDLLGLT
jgi:hypothetical protein